RVAELAVPFLADWCMVHILEDGRPKTLAVAHVDPTRVALAWELDRRFPTEPNEDRGVARVVRTGRPEVFPEITEEMLTRSGRDHPGLCRNGTSVQRGWRSANRHRARPPLRQRDRERPRP